MERKIIKFAEIAEKTRIPINTLRWYRHRGDGPPTWILGGRVVAYEDEIDAWVEEQRRGGAA